MWPTAKALTGGANSRREERGAGGPDLQEAVQSWATPTAVMTRGGWTAEQLVARQEEVKQATKDRGVHHTGNGFGLSLAAQASIWQTPRASDGEKGGPNQKFGAGGIPLPAQAAQWPTPAARDWKGENGAEHLTNGSGRLHLDQLPNAVAHCFTRPDLPTWGGGLTYLSHRQTSRRLLRSATSHLSPGKLRQWLKRGWWRKRRLNPLFVEWLMAWPPGHALCACSATAFTLWQQDMRGALSALPTASGPWIWLPPATVAAPEQMSLI